MMKASKFFTAIFLGLSLGTAPVSWAEGFVCVAPTESLEVWIFNSTHFDAAGERDVAVMLISDPSLPRSDRTLALFESNRVELKSEGTLFTANVNSQPFSVEKSILGLRLAQIQDIVLRVDFSQQTPIEDGTWLHGVFELYALNGDQLWVDMDCQSSLRGSSI
jgi:hypothetical protein